MIDTIACAFYNGVYIMVREGIPIDSIFKKVTSILGCVFIVLIVGISLGIGAVMLLDKLSGGTQDDLQETPQVVQESAAEPESASP
ncbi:MAG: hypothetical protein FWG48_00600 [Oscillospiraceae bacterium]|nr:hypothetical protein [Oscillospiraceae bacterium]